jgi:hypothetical protein
MSFNPDKTEIMIFSNRSIPENLDFSLNGKSVPTTTSMYNISVFVKISKSVTILTALS